jgi:hypothetical protein
MCVQQPRGCATHALALKLGARQDDINRETAEKVPGENQILGSLQGVHNVHVMSRL